MSEIRPAATLALVRNGAEGVETLLLQRTRDAVFLPGFHVFPGGALQDREQSPPHATAALRECFEEAGLLLVRGDEGNVRVHAVPENTDRHRIDIGTLSLGEYCRREGVEPATDALIYLNRWVTPPGPPRRFDTHFFLAAVPPDQDAFPDGNEAVDHVWMAPEEALRAHLDGRMLFVPPTLNTLRCLRGFRNTNELLAARASEPPGGVSQAWPARRDGDRVELSPGETGYDEARFLDPDGLGDTSTLLEPERPVRLTDAITRLTAPNPGVMTGPGTNTYIVEDERGFMVIDPGPALENHLERILELCGERIHHVLITHTHPDHSPGTAWLRERCGAKIVGLPAPDDPVHDGRTCPDLVPGEGESIGQGASRLRALRTPGHASNHLCFMMDATGMLFAGDMMMQGSTVVINPPDGDMGDYLASLKRLLDEPVRWLLPGHGPLMGEPLAVLDYLIMHRHVRERKVMGALRALGPSSEEATLMERVYSDVPRALHPVAARSLRAHLIRLEREGRVKRQADGWTLMD